MPVYPIVGLRFPIFSVRLLVCSYVVAFVCPFVPLSVCPVVRHYIVCLSISPSFRPSVRSPVRLIACPIIRLFVRQSLLVYVSPSACPPVRLSACLFVCLFACPSVLPFAPLSCHPMTQSKRRRKQ